MNYPIVIHKDKDSDYGVTVPDLPGCFSAGSTIDEAIAMAREAIELHLEGLIEDGQVVPDPGVIEDYQNLREHKGGVWALVSIAPSSLRTEAKRVNITMPRRILDAVDRCAQAEGQTRSGLLVKAATAYIAPGSPGVKRPGTRQAPTKRFSRRQGTAARGRRAGR